MIDWNQPAETIRNFVRGLSPYPTAWIHLNGKTYKIYKVTVVEQAHIATVGESYTDGKTFIHVAATDGWLSIEELQAEGKRKMTVGEFLRGNRLD